MTLTVEEILDVWAKQPGAVVSADERVFITHMRQARAAGVGYGWMLQVIEWEWRANDPTRTPQADGRSES